jgi:hypothetical protein
VRRNPLGLSFHLRFYAAAPGCASGGPPTAEHTWFPPLAWQVANCAGCVTHCGWLFGGDGVAFAALIIDRIEEEPDE